MTVPTPDVRRVRAWLIALLAQDPSTDSVLESRLVDDATRMVEDEGVLALVAQLLDGGEWPTLSQALSPARKHAVVRALLLKAETRALLALLAGQGLPALLLKGSALAYWLYPAPELRECADIDLLFHSRQAAEAATVALESRGYRRRERALPGDMTTFEITCTREIAALTVEVDLHWDIGGAPVYAGRLPVVDLFDAAMEVSGHGFDARALEPVHAFLHAAMHRALNLHLVGDPLKWLYDFRLLSRSFDPLNWRRLQDLCERRGLCSTALSALDAAAAVGAVVPEPTRRALLAAAKLESLDCRKMRSWRYVQYRNLVALPDFASRLRWLRQRLWPDATYLADMYADSPRGWRRLTSYLRHGLAKLMRPAHR